MTLCKNDNSVLKTPRNGESACYDAVRFNIENIFIKNLKNAIFKLTVTFFLSINE